MGRLCKPHSLGSLRWPLSMEETPMPARLLVLALVSALSAFVEAPHVYAKEAPVTIKIALTGESVPGGNGVLGRLGDPALNEFGMVAFPASLIGTHLGAADDKAIFIYSRNRLIEVVREGQTAPDGDGTFGDATFG